MKGDATSAFLKELLKDGLARHSGEQYTLQFTEEPMEDDIDALELSEKAKNQIKALLEVALRNVHYNEEENLGLLKESNKRNTAAGGGYTRQSMRRNRKNKKARKANTKKNRKF